MSGQGRKLCDAARVCFARLSIPAALRREGGQMDLMGDFFHMPLKSRLFCYFKKIFLRIGCSVASFLLALRENVLCQ